jgi:hypothetical protein
MSPQHIHPIGSRERCCPCHRLPVSGGPARVWCRVSGRQFQADDPKLSDGPCPS